MFVLPLPPGKQSADADVCILVQTTAQDDYFLVHSKWASLWPQIYGFYGSELSILKTDPIHTKLSMSTKSGKH